MPDDQAPAGPVHERRERRDQGVEEEEDREAERRPAPRARAGRSATAWCASPGAATALRPTRRSAAVTSSASDGEHQAEGERQVTAQEPVGVDHPGEGGIAEQVDGAEVGDRVEEHQQRAGGDGRAGLGQHDLEEHRHRPAAEQPGRLLDRWAERAQAGGDGSYT